MNVMKTLFEELVSPEQKLLSDLVNSKGGIAALRNNDKMLLDIEKTANKVSGLPSVGGRPTRQNKSTNADLEIDSLRMDILEDPEVAAANNRAIASRKFEAQKNQIIDELARTVQRESDEVIRMLEGSAGERILDQVGFP